MDGHAERRSQYREIFRFVRGRVDSAESAEDVTQDVFTQAAEVLARSAESAPPTLGWLYTVARRRLIDEARRKRVSTVPLELVGEPTAAIATYGTSVARALESGLAHLPEKQRQVVSMRLLGGWSFAEISKKTGVSEAACRMRFMRGLEELRAEFEREGLDG